MTPSPSHGQEPEIRVWIEGRIGRLELNRPRAMNALTWPMTQAAEQALDRWRDSDSVDAVLVTGAGERGLCAGADIRQMAGMDADESYAFLDHEYGLNLVINQYPKPYIALMDGVTMGGGMGLSAHGSHRIVTERSRLAMPECRIGLIPDVGMSYLLARSPGELGTYLSLTASEASGADALLLGLADAFVPSERLAALVADLTALPRATGAAMSVVV